MTIQEILAIETPSRIIEAICKDPDNLDTENAWKAYEGDHAILHDPSRRDLVVGKGDKSRWVKRAKETLTFQKKIVETGIAFVFGEPVALTYGGQDEDATAFEAVEDVWTRNKMDYFNRKLMRTVSVETRAAEMWRIQVAPDGTKRIKCQLLRERDGHKIYPHWDDEGDMDALTVRFRRQDIDATGRVTWTEVVKIFTADQFITYTRGTGQHRWTIEAIPNPYGKIPAVYYEQDAPEWQDVDKLISRLEYVISGLADTNDYFGAPVLKLKGALIADMPEKEQDGKTLVFKGEQTEQGAKYGDADYLTWEHSPESIKLEIEKLVEFIYSMTSTPDIAFSNIKGIGNVSGIALKLMFLDAMLKAKAKEEIYGEGIERRLNIIRAMLAVSDVKLAGKLEDLDIGIDFKSPLPENIMEIIDMLVAARGSGPIISRETAVDNNPLVQNVRDELERLEGELGQSGAPGMTPASFDL